MTWLDDHKSSERLAAEAEVSALSGDFVRAQQLYKEAAVFEMRALDQIDSSKSRTLGISAVSAASLYFKANELHQVEMVAYRWLGSQHLPGFAVEQLRSILQATWSEEVREQAGIGFVPGQVIISVKGGEVIEGGAPLDLIVEKVQTVQSLFYRTAEFLRNLPHRKRGGPIKEIQESCRPWLFQTAPGSYQFAVAVQEPRQQNLFQHAEAQPKQVAGFFLSILQASIQAPEEELPEIVPDKEYRTTFLKLTRNLAPTGKTFAQLDIRSAVDTKTITLLPSTRKTVGKAIRQSKPTASDGPEEEETLHGVLRAVHLDQDWIEVIVDTAHHRIYEVGEAVDDVIGPMVNKPVIVQVVKAPQNRYNFRDIEADD